MIADFGSGFTRAMVEAMGVERNFSLNSALADAYSSLGCVAYCPAILPCLACDGAAYVYGMLLAGTARTRSY